MYIANKYWNHYIGDTDDSLTLVEYLAGKQKKNISLQEICSDFGLDLQQDHFQETATPLVFEDTAGWEMEIHFAIDCITDLAALLLECRVSGSVNLCELFGSELSDATEPEVCITATPEEHERIHQALKVFVAAPLTYDLSEMAPEEEMRQMAAVCEELRKELYE